MKMPWCGPPNSSLATTALLEEYKRVIQKDETGVPAVGHGNHRHVAIHEPGFEIKNECQFEQSNIGTKQNIWILLRY